MPDQKTKAKKEPLGRRLAEDAKAFGESALRQLFGMTKNWDRLKDVGRNNYELGLKHLKLGNTSDAVMRFKIVTWLDPNHAGAWYGLGCAYVAEGKKAQAREALSRALKLKPDYEEAAYMFAIAGGKLKEPLKRMPPSLVREHFEKQAPDFARTQLETFGYKGHTALADVARACLIPGRIDHEILELGVGTGLCGALLKSVASRLTGVDISGAMLNQAMKLQDEQGKKIYDSLVQRDALVFLQEAAANSYDIVLAAQTLSYVGELGGVFQQVARVIKSKGVFAFTADKMDGEGFALDLAAGRFRFSQNYLRQLAAANGLKEIKFIEVETYPDYKEWACAFAKSL